MQDKVVVRECGTRHLGCDESSGWIWYAAKCLEEVLVSNTALLEAHPNSGVVSCTRNEGQGDNARSDNNILEGMKILELGSGTGWLSLRLAARGFHLTATDRPGAIPLLLQNVLRNQEKFRDLEEMELQVEVFPLEWDSTTRVEGSWDLLIASDVLYLNESHRALLETVLRHDGKRCIIAWEQRKVQEEQEFVKLASSLGFSCGANSPFVAGTHPATQNPIWIIVLLSSKTELYME